MGFGVLLRRLRVAAGLSQEALAEGARISAKAVGALELGTRRAPYRETVEQLIIALNASEDEASQLTALAERARKRGLRTRGQTPPAPYGNFPLTSTRLIGREADVARAAALLTNHRCVTLVGAGGVGKTRVALSVGRQQATEFVDGSWFVDLAPLSDPKQLPHAVATALGIVAAPSGDVVVRIADFLASRRALVVLDNCEHLLDAAAQLARTVLDRSTNVRLLATSREPLRIAGEAVYETPALGFPPLGVPLTACAALKYPAVELFVERASSHDANFVLRDDDAAIAARIVRRVDGLPLAIELAAARVRTLGLATVERRLDRRFEVLTGGERTGPSRQQTMRALIEWSYKLLPASEQLTFSRLSVFAGGWTLEAAESVCGADRCEHIMVDLASLVEKSLVVKYEQRNSLRYHLLESMHDFAREILPRAEFRPLAHRHADWVAATLKNLDERSATESASARLGTLFVELENVRAALLWCECADERLLAARIASLIAEPFYWYGLADEGAASIERALGQLKEAEHPDVAARLHIGLARLASDAHKRVNAAARAVTLAQRCEDPGLLASAYARYAVALYLIGKLEEALFANDRALELSQCGSIGSDLRVAWQMQHRSWILVELRRLDEARACVEEAIEIFSRFGAEREAWGVRGDLAELEFAAGRAERALEIVDEATVVAAEAEDFERQSVLICNRAGYLLSLGDITEAEASAREAVRLGLKTFGSERVLHALEHLAAALACRGELETAALLAGFVDAGYAGSGYERETTERNSHEILVNSLLRGWPEQERLRVMRRGAAMTKAQAVERALRTV